MADKIKILYIDDEPNNLIGFKAVFRMEYQILTAGSASEGFLVLKEHSDVKIIFCDQKMPEKTGVQFFEEISDIYPEPVRMLLTGYMDIESVIAAINKGHVYRFLSKPWQEPDVRSAIEEGYRYYMTISALATKNIELQKANAELDRFAYSVTHDIKGPIVSMIGALEIVKHSDDLEEIKHVAALMEESADKANQLIENIHSYYSLKRGSLSIEQIDFQKMLEEIIGLYEVNKKLSGIKIRTVVHQDVPFRCDKTLLQLVINNLLSNAVKYQKQHNDGNFVDIAINAKQDVAEITVSDNGIGIEEQYLKDIFKMFFRATKESTGSGFGLYNVSDAVEKLKGTIEVNSKVNEGTTFLVTIPQK